MATRWSAWLGPLDAARCRVEVFTFKEGVLSAIAHDLRLRASRLSGDVSEAGVKVAIEAASLEVVCARAAGRDAPELLSERDRRRIEATLRAEVLHVAKHPEIRFESARVVDEEGGVRVEGMLRLNGAMRPLSIELREASQKLEGQVALHQPDFGITPYEALLGTLKVQPRVKVQISLSPAGSPSPAPGGASR
jgi:polyisoprenoid-binding protein YceI